MVFWKLYNRLITFASVHHAIRAERLLGAAEISGMALPTPREIDVSCGQSLLFAADRQDDVMKILTAQQVQWSRLYEVQSGEWRKYLLLTVFEEDKNSADSNST